MTSAGLDPELLALLVEPETRHPLRYDPERQILISDISGLAYPVRDGIPILLVEEATPVAPPDTHRRNTTPPARAADSEAASDKEAP